MSDLFKRLLREVAVAGFQDVPGERMSNAEVLARGIMNAALLGDKAARELVIDRVEGKAVRGQTVQTADMTVEDQVDEAMIALLSAPTDKGPENV